MHVDHSNELPPRMLARLSPPEARLAAAWWGTLGDAERGELLAAWDPRAGSCSYAQESGEDGAARWQRLELRVEAEPEKEGGGSESGWPLDLYEYLVGHEIVLADHRPYHICQRHEAGRSAAREARIGEAFACPLQAGDCPLQALGALAHGGAVRLIVRGKVALDEAG